MASGIKGSCNRPKRPKNLRSQDKGKRFSQLSAEGLANYSKKLMRRAERKRKRGHKKQVKQQLIVG